MLQKTTEGYIYISPKTDIHYNLLEGMSIAGDKQYTSDIIFIMLTSPDYNVDDNVVGYLFGASMIVESEKKYEDSIKVMVDEFETRNNL